MQFFYMRHCAFAHRTSISVVLCDFYPLKTLATGRKGRRSLQKLRLTSTVRKIRFEYSVTNAARIRQFSPGTCRMCQWRGSARC
jgi:hypothetical protein